MKAVKMRLKINLLCLVFITFYGTDAFGTETRYIKGKGLMIKELKR